MLSGLALPALKGSQLLLYFSASVAHILRLSHGRDKVFGLLQNIADLYKQCMFEYLRLYRIREWPFSVKNAHALQIALKNGRKFFRLLRWLEEMGRVEKKMHENFKPTVLLKAVRHVIGVVYYFLDNVIWTINIGLIGEIGDSNSRLEKTKDFLSLIRYVMRIVIFAITFHSKAMGERGLRMDLLTNPDKEIRMNSHGYAMTCSMIKARSNRRFQTLEMGINVFRIIMLVKSLKLPGSNVISAVFYSVCGVISVSLSLFKLLTHKSSPVITYYV
jgi:hypothetical protein